MGGSLARALKTHDDALVVTGWSPDRREREAVVRAGAADRAPPTLDEAVADAELVVLAAPLEASCRLLGEAARASPPEATLSDIASLKEPMARAAAAAGVADRWVGTHPMAGAATSGFAASRSDLFVGARVWIVAGAGAAGRAEALQALWRSLYARPAAIEAEAHDRLMALVSHAPQVISTVLVSTFMRESVSPHEMGPAARDMTRLASSSPSMWIDLFAHAPPDLPRALRDVAARCVEVAELLERADPDALDSIGRLMRETGSWRRDA
jgi:prephenate dehydrogenase